MNKKPDIKRKSPVPYIIVFVVGMWLVYGDKSELSKAKNTAPQTGIQKEVAKATENLLTRGKLNTDDDEIEDDVYTELARTKTKKAKPNKADNDTEAAPKATSKPEPKPKKPLAFTDDAVTKNAADTAAPDAASETDGTAEGNTTASVNASKKKASFTKKLFLGTVGFGKNAVATVRKFFLGTTGNAIESNTAGAQKPFYNADDGYIMPFSPDFNANMNAVDELGISVVLIVDVSGSMNLPPEAGGERKYIQAARAVESIASYIEELQFGTDATAATNGTYGVAEMMDGVAASGFADATADGTRAFDASSFGAESSLNAQTAPTAHDAFDTGKTDSNGGNSTEQMPASSVSSDSHGELLINVAVLTFDNVVTELMPLTRMDKNGCTKFKTLAQNPHNFKPNGNTAVGAALQKGSEILAASGTILNTMLLVTDGKNNFAPHPEDVLKAIYSNRNSAYTAAHPVRTDTQLVSIIGFDVQDPAFDTYRAIGSRVVTASDQTELQEALKSLLQADITKLE